MNQAHRRRFLTSIGSASALAGLSVAGLRLIENHSVERAPSPLKGAAERELPTFVVKRAPALGTIVSIKVLHADTQLADRAIDGAFAELELVEELMSVYRPHSQLSQLNRTGLLDCPHPYLVRVLRDAQRLSRLTHGAFDVTVQPLWELYSASGKVGRLPTEEEIAKARRHVDWRRLSVSDSSVRLSGRGTKVTLNGIAQGFAADRVAAVLRAHGITRALIDTGELEAVGTKPTGEAWTVGIQHPRDPEAFLSLAALAGRCLATSGDYATAFSPDHKHHHLFDPRTGFSPRQLSSVSIAAESAQQADALSTAVFVMGMDRGLALVESIPAADALLVDKQGKTLQTKDFPRRAPPRSLTENGWGAFAEMVS